MIPTILHADMLDALAGLDADSIDAVVTDPPYHLTSITKRLGSATAAPIQHGTDGAFARLSRGFMGKTWDGGDIAFRPETWTAVLRVMKPGAHLVAFGGTRTFHRMAVAIEDAGFDIRDTLMWLYGCGWAKSHAADKAIDKRLGATGTYGEAEADPDAMEAGRVYIPATAEAQEWAGWGTALKPAWEPIILARKPLAGTVAANVLARGTGAINIDACRVEVEGARPLREARPNSVSDAGRNTYGTGIAGSVAAGETTTGRWPANVLHDGSDEVEAAFAAFGTRSSGAGNTRKDSGADRNGNLGSAFGAESRPAGTAMVSHGDSGSASRFFFSGKATAEDRAGSKHPTVKPVALMRWLVRLVTPRGGLILDPFAGSGTTGAAAMAEGMRAMLIEREAEYVADIRRRFAEAAPLFAQAAAE